MALMSRATHVLQWLVQRVLQDREVELISESQSQFGLKSVTRLHEVGIASNRGSACHGEYVPGLVHTARHTTKVGCTRSH